MKFRTWLFWETSFNKGRNTEYTFQTDYVHPFSESVKIEVGGKSVLRRIESDYNYQSLEAIQSAFVTDPSRTDLFDYQQDVYAGYASLNLTFAKVYSLIAGARYEHTNIEGDFRDAVNPFANDYGNLVPSFIISKKIKTIQFTKIRLQPTYSATKPAIY